MVLSLVPCWVVLWQTLWQEYGLVTHATAHVTWKWEGTRSPTTKHPHFDLNYYAVDKQELMFWLLRWVRPLRGVDLDSILLLHFNTIIGVVSPMFLFQFSMVRSSVSITKHKTLLTLHHKPRFGNLNKKYPRESHMLLVKKQSPHDSFPSTINDLGIRKRDIQFPIKIVVGLFWPISLVLQTSTRSSLGSIIGTHTNPGECGFGNYSFCAILTQPEKGVERGGWWNLFVHEWLTQRCQHSFDNDGNEWFKPQTRRCSIAATFLLPTNLDNGFVCKSFTMIGSQLTEQSFQENSAGKIR